MELEQLIKIAAEPHLVDSAKEATKLVAELNSHLSHLRLEFDEFELKVNLEKNQLHDDLKRQGKTERYIENYLKTTNSFQELKKKERVLRDLRAIRRNLEKHKDLLVQQEMYKPHNYGNYPRAI